MPAQRGSSTIVKPDPAGAPFKPGTKAYDQAVRKAKAQRASKAAGASYWSLQAHGLTPHAPVPEKQAQPKQTGSTLGLPDAGTGLGSSGKGAKTKAVPNLTAQVALARARQERLAQGGLLSPAQRAAEAVASTTVPTRPDFAAPPPEGKAPAIAPKAKAETEPSGNPAYQALVKAKAGRSKGGLPSVTDILGGITHAASVGLGTPLAAAAKIPSTLFHAPVPTYTGGGLDAGHTAIERAKPTAFPAAYTGVETALAGLSKAKGAIPSGAVEVAQADLTPAGRKLLAKNGVTGPIDLKTLIDTYGEGNLGPRVRKQLIDLAAKNGHNVQDAKTWTDQDAAQFAFNPYKHSASGFVRNFAADIGGFMALPQIAPALASGAISAAHGDFQPLARTGGQLVDQWKNHLAIVGDRPIWENFYDAPITTFTSNAPVLKGVGLRVGKTMGLEAEREVTLPTTSRVDPETGETVPHKVTVPATQNALTRPLTKVSDAILARSQHPLERRQAHRVDNILDKPRPLAALGHQLEKRYAHKAGEKSRTMATLAKGHEARQAQNELISSVRALPARVRDIRVGAQKVESEGVMRKVSNKQQHAESIVEHTRLGLSSDEAVRYWESKMAETDHQIAEAHNELSQARESGDKAAVGTAQQAIDELGRIKQAQQTHRDFSAANPVDIHNLTPPEQRVADAFRNASRVVTGLKADRGTMGEAGQLYGDLKDNLEATARLHPDTPQGRLATIALTHRETMMTLEQKMGTLADRSSPLAQSHLGRVKVLDKALEDISGRRQAVRDRRERARSTGPNRAQAEVGTDKGTLHRIVQEGRSALTAKRERHAVRVRAEEKIATEMETEQRGSHGKVSDAQIQSKRIQLRDAERRAKSPVDRVARKGDEDVKRITEEVGALERIKEHGFTPDDRLVAQRAKVERMKGENAAIELFPGQSSAIARRHIDAAQEKAIGEQTLHDAIHENQRAGAERELGRLHARLQAQRDESAATFEKVSGSATEASLRHEKASADFVDAMKTYKAHLDDGVDPYHVTLRRPGDRSGSTAVKVSGDTQFPEGNYTQDIHIQVSADLEANAKVAVEDEMFRHVSKTPYVMHDPPPNSKIPPGFALTDAEALKTPRKPIFGSDENEDLIDTWQKQRRSPAQYVPDDGKKYALVARDMQDWLTEIVRPKVDFDNARLNAVLHFTNQYRRWMLFTLPRTLINNALGNPVLAAIGGAGIIDYIRAVHILRNHPEVIPSTLRHIGPIANVGETMKLTGYQAFWRNANVFHEDLGRLTTYIHHVVRHAKHDQGLKFYNRIDMGSELTTNYLKDLAEGKNPDVLKFTDEATKWFGNMSKRNKWDPVLATGFLFHRWVGHMIHLTLWTMPIHYPGRTAFLLNLSTMADDYRKEHGNLPDWAKPIVGLLTSVDTVAGLPQKVLWGVNTGSVNPLATPGQTLSIGSESSGSEGANPLSAVMSANLNPVAQTLFAYLTGKRLDNFSDLKDTYGRAVGPMDTRTGIHQLIANAPVISSLFPATGLADNAIQADPNAARRYSAAGLRDPSFYPPAQPHGWNIGPFSLMNMLWRLGKAGGFSVSAVDSKGPRTQHSAQSAAQAIYQQAQADNKNVAAAHAQATARISAAARKPTP